MQKVEERRTVRMSLTILITVAACDLIKLTCMLSVLRLRNFDPLITISDAIASFLDERDISTAGCGMLGAEQIPTWRQVGLWNKRTPPSKTVVRGNRT